MDALVNELILRLAVPVGTAAAAAVSASLTHLLVQKAGKERLQKLQATVETEAAKVAAAAEKMGITEDVVKKMVLYVQQEYETLGGPEKRQKALDAAAAALGSIGIQTSADQLSVMIGTAVKVLKKDFADQWKTQVEDVSVAPTQDAPPAAADTTAAATGAAPA